MSAAGSKSAQKIVVAGYHERTTPSMPILATLTEAVKLLFRATQDREFTADSQLSLDALRQAVKLTRPYILHLQQELESHDIELATSGNDRVKQQFDVATLLTGLAKLARELARTRDNRPNGSVRLTLLREVYHLLFVEMKSAREEVKRLEHLLEGKHTRKRHRRHCDQKTIEGNSGDGMNTAEEGSARRNASSLGKGSDEAGSQRSGSLDGKAIPPLSEEATRVYPDAVKVQSHDGQRSLSTRASRPSRVSQLGVERSSSYVSSVQRGRPAITDNLRPLTEPIPQIESEGPVKPGSHASSQQSRSTKAPTVNTTSEIENSNSPTHSRDASKPQHEDQRKSSSVMSQAEDPHDLSQLATHTSKRGSIKTISWTSNRKSVVDRPPEALSAASQRSEQRSSRSGSAVAVLGTRYKQDDSDTASESRSVQSASTVATLGTGSKTKEAKLDDRGQSHESDLPATREAAMTSKQTVPADHVSCQDRLDGGWSFDALKSGSRASLEQRLDGSKAKSQESKTKCAYVVCEPYSSNL